MIAGCYYWLLFATLPQVLSPSRGDMAEKSARTHRSVSPRSCFTPRPRYFK